MHLRRFAKAVSVALAFSLMLSGTAANAAGTGVVVFAGKATISCTADPDGGLGLPGSGDDSKGTICTWAAPFGTPGTPKAKPGNLPVVGSVCLGAEVSIKKPGVVAGPECNFSGFGTVEPGILGGPWCGHSEGFGAANLTFNRNPTVTEGAIAGPALGGGWWSSGTIVFATTSHVKGGQSGPGFVLIHAFGDVIFKDGPSSQCRGGTATDFLAVGAAAAVVP